jgi:hypothetical protein
MDKELSTYFSDPISQSQIMCPCGCGKNDLDSEIYMDLDRIRMKIGRPLNINSGCRCKKHDLDIYLAQIKARWIKGELDADEYHRLNLEEVEKERTSSHITSLAVDLRVNGSKEREEIVATIYGMNRGIHRIGIARTFVHFDIDPSKPSALWLY